jgi:hypothetical protein
VPHRYATTGAAHLDYLVLRVGNDVETTEAFAGNYLNWQTYPIKLGDEADVWGGIRDSPTPIEQLIMKYNRGGGYF